MNVLAVAQGAGVADMPASEVIRLIAVACAVAVLYNFAWFVPWTVVAHRWAQRYVDRVGIEQAQRSAARLVGPVKALGAAAAAVLLVTGTTTVGHEHMYWFGAACSVAMVPLVFLWRLRIVTRRG